MHLTLEETTRLHEILHDWSDTRQALRMRRFVQHGTISTYDHCMRVARTSYWLNHRLHLHSDEESLVRGAFLHDFYLYDWHACHAITHWHGFTHPAIALHMAERYYSLTPKERMIIRCHMWPLTFRAVPLCREALLVSIADKWCSLGETLHRS